MEVVLLAIAGLFNIVCFIVGAKVGQAVSKGEKIEMPKLDPLKTYRDKEAKKEAKKQQDKYATILRNIERYDGTGRNQEDVG
jgi:hypothetical protein